MNGNNLYLYPRDAIAARFCFLREASHYPRKNRESNSSEDEVKEASVKEGRNFTELAVRSQLREKRMKKNSSTFDLNMDQWAERNYKKKIV